MDNSLKDMILRILATDRQTNKTTDLPVDLLARAKNTFQILHSNNSLNF